MRSTYLSMAVKTVIGCICIISILLLCIHSYLNFDKYDPSVKQFLSNQEKYDGRFAVNRGEIIYKEGKSINKGMEIINKKDKDDKKGEGVNKEDETYLKTGGEVILLKYHEKIKRARFGHTTLTGVYKKAKKGVNAAPPHILVKDYNNNDYNYSKYVVSFFALIIFLFLFFKEWKITFRGIIPKKI